MDWHRAELVHSMPASITPTPRRRCPSGAHVPSSVVRRGGQGTRACGLDPVRASAVTSCRPGESAPSGIVQLGRHAACRGGLKSAAADRRPWDYGGRLTSRRKDGGGEREAAGQLLIALLRGRVRSRRRNYCRGRRGCRCYAGNQLRNNGGNRRSFTHRLVRLGQKLVRLIRPRPERWLKRVVEGRCLVGGLAH